MNPRTLDATRRYGIALLATGAVTVVIGLILGFTRIANISTLYLIVVLVAATRLGRGPAIAASVAAFFLYDWFFALPLHQLTIADPAEWLALGVFLVIAIITSELAANERRRALQAVRREREAVLLYDALRDMGDPDIEAGLRAAADRLRTDLRIGAVSIKLVVGGVERTATSGQWPADLATTALLGSGRPPIAGVAGGPARWIRMVPPRGEGANDHFGRWRLFEVPIQSDTRRIGQISFAREASHGPFSAHESRLLALIAKQLASVAGRIELQETTTRAEVLKRTDELKTALLNAVSHDLRSPLASIIASAESLRQTDVPWTERERAEFVEAIEQQAERLSRIVSNLLDLSRIEAGALKPDKQLHDVGAVIDDVIDRLRPATEGHRVAVHLAADLPPVPLDEVQIDQVLSNLVENAAKYSPPGSDIEVSVYRGDPDLVVEVTDRGPGIPTEEIGRLFTPFHRVTRAGPRTSGFGVGLAVAKGLVEAHGGRIWASNRADGGARFVFTLPLASAPERRPAGAAAR